MTLKDFTHVYIFTFTYHGEEKSFKSVVLKVKHVAGSVEDLVKTCRMSSGEFLI